MGQLCDGTPQCLRTPVFLEICSTSELTLLGLRIYLYYYCFFFDSILSVTIAAALVVILVVIRTIVPIFAVASIHDCLCVDCVYVDWQ